MDVTVRTEKTYLVTMTEPQARNMLRLARAINSDDISVAEIDKTGTLETLDNLRQGLLSSGLTLKDPD
jgi:hypothetical protein